MARQIGGLIGQRTSERMTEPGGRLRRRERKLGELWVSLGRGCVDAMYCSGEGNRLQGERLDSVLHMWTLRSPWVEMSRRHLELRGAGPDWKEDLAVLA